MKKHDFTQYVHEYDSILLPGQIRYAVGEWRQEAGEYIRPLDKTEAVLTGCGWEFAKRPSGLQSFPTRRQALRRARYLFYEQDKEFMDFCDEMELP